MPQNPLADAQQRLGEALALGDSRIADLKASPQDDCLRDRLIVAREFVRQALRGVEYAQETITGGTQP